MPPGDIERLADQFMEGLRIKEHAKKYSNDCSGGTKRKLSYAMAMLGNPKIVLLDEPRKEEFISWRCTFCLNLLPEFGFRCETKRLT